MKIRMIAVAALTALLFACKEKAAPPASTAAPVANENKIQSGMYMGSAVGSCLCVNAEKGLAGDSGTLTAMSIDLGTGLERASDDMKAALKERFEDLRFVSKEQIVTRDGGAKFTRVQKANDCELLNTSAAEPLGYQDFCLEGRAVGKMKQL